MTEPGTLVLRTLADYRAFTLGAFCPACDRSVVLDHQALADRLGDDVLLEDIRRRLTCQQCGRRPQRLLVGYEQAGR
jgi:ribosomal protein S27AE